MLVTACIIVRDGESTVGRCLESLAGLVDEIVVVDTGSVDRTIEVCSAYDTRIFKSAWRDDFSFHRNESLEHARGEWALIIDADEWVERGDFDSARGFLNSPDASDILMVHHVSQAPASGQRREFLPRLIRLNSGIRYIYPIHEQLDIAEADAVLANITLHHSGYADAALKQKKLRRNLRIALTMEVGHPYRTLQLMRTYAGLDEWDSVGEFARDLLERNDIRDDVRINAHIHAAISARQSSRPSAADFSFHLSEAEQLDPNHPDIHFLRFVDAGSRFVQSAKGNSLGKDCSFAGPSLFGGKGAAVSRFLSEVTRTASCE